MDVIVAKIPIVIELHMNELILISITYSDNFMINKI